MTLTVGATLGGRYKVLRLLGRGGMGAVYLATDDILGKEVALKVMHPQLAGNALDRLRDEVLLAQKVTHQNVCRTWDLEEIDGHFLVKMEYVAGESLADRIAREDRLRLDDALQVARGIAAGLEAAHAQGVVHRDLKPHNVLLEAATGRVVLMDFGIAAAMHQTSERAVGSPEYMAPEQARAEAVDARTDLYALGCVLYHMLIGEVPFPATTPVASMLRHLMDPIPDPRGARPDVPSWVAKVIRRLLEKDPKRRFTDAAEVQRALAGPRRIDWRRAGAAVLGVVVAALVGGISLYRYLSVTTIDCANIASGRGVLLCVGELAPEAQRSRALTYRFHRQRGRLLRVDRIRGSGRLAEDEGGRASWEYSYDERGAPKETVIRDRHGQVKLRLVSAADGRRVDRRDAHDNPLPEEGTDVAVFLQELDGKGHLARQRFANVYGSPRPDRRGAYGYAVECDGRGLVTALEVLGPDGKPAATADGIVRVRVRRDEQGNPVEEQIFGAGGRLAASREGYAVVRRKFDGVGNLLEESYLGTDGKPVAGARGYASLRAHYNDIGERVQLSFFGPDGAPALGEDGWATVRSRWDADGYLVEESYFGVYGEPTLGRGGFAVRRRSVDVARRMIIESYLDQNGKPAITQGTQAGYAEVREIEDAEHYPVEQRFLDERGRPTLTRDGASVRRLRYDASGRLVEEALFGVDDRPTLHRAGWSVHRLRRDERGRVVEDAYFDVTGRLVDRKDGYVVARAKYDEQGNRSEIAYSSAPTEKTNASPPFEVPAVLPPARHASGYSTVRAVWDGRGKLVEESCFGPAGERVTARGGASRLRYGYDEGGHLVSEEAFDPRDQPAILPAGWSKRRARFDARGRMVEERYLDGASNPVACKDGYAIWRAWYDEQGNRVEERYLDGEERLVAGASGAAVVKSEYKARGLRVLESWFDTDEKPVAHQGGWYAVRTGFDPWARPVLETYLGPDGKPRPVEAGYAQVRTRYDTHSRVSDRTFLSIDTRPVMTRDGYSSVRYQYDRWGHRIEERYLGLDATPVAARGGVAGSRSVFDDDGELVRRIEFDLAAKPLAGIGRAPGVALAIGASFGWTLDAKGQVVVMGGSGEAGENTKDAKNRKPRASDPTRDALIQIAEAHREGFALEQLRATNEALFRGARGVLLVDVTADGPAARAGLRPGDLLLEYDGRPLDRPNDLIAATGNARAPVQAHLLRRGEPLVLSLPPGRLGIGIEHQ